VRGRSPDGSAVRALGHGPWLGDEGSAFWVAREAVRQVLRRADAGEEGGSLARTILERAGVDQAHELPRCFPVAATTPSRLAGLAPAVLEAAQEGDAAAVSLLDEGADLLAEAVVRVHRRLRGIEGPCPLGLAGGWLIHAVPFRERLLAKVGDGSRLEPVLVEHPVVGCLALARRAHEGRLSS